MRDRQGRDAAEASYDFWASPDLALAQQVRVNGGDGSPTAGRPVVRDARLLPAGVQRQLAAARPSASIAHRTQRAVPTRRQLRRKARRAAQRVLVRFSWLALALVLGVLFAGASGLLGR